MTKKRLVDRIIDRIGRRGAVLTLLSFVYFLLGLKAILDPAMDMGSFQFYTMMPFWLRAVMWIVPALCGMFAASLQKGKNDGIGFAALCIPAAIMTGSYFVSFLGFLAGITGGAGNLAASTGWVNALEWGAILAVLVITSGWAEVEREVTYISLTDKEVE